MTSTHRVALLTPEFGSEREGGGGVGNYVLKMAIALRAAGHQATVFVPSQHGEGPLVYAGASVVRVASARNVVLRALAKGLSTLDRHGSVVLQVADARRLASAVEAAHAQEPFDIVQSSNYRLTGLFVRSRQDRRHVIRLSTSRLLFDTAHGHGPSPLGRLIEHLDVRAQRRADAVYAPSRLLADYFSARYGHAVAVVRPPLLLGDEPATTAPLRLPPRYLVHFGTLGQRKGTLWLARALPQAWKQQPDLRVVMAGPILAEERTACLAHWGGGDERVTWLGRLAKPQLYGVVQHAVVSVLPSLADNLPNTVLESLALGVPVIGTNGASIDELVTHGVDGALVPIDDDTALAEAMVTAWRGEAPWATAPIGSSPILHDMRPDEAVRHFLDLAAPSS